MPLDIVKTLLDNKDKQFVQRILNSGIFPVVENEGGSVSTHRMAAEIDDNGDWLVFPTIVSLPSGELFDMPDHQTAMNYAKETGEFIGFGKGKDNALSFAENGYKKWNKSAPLLGQQIPNPLGGQP